MNEHTLIQSARAYAKTAHGGQVRKGAAGDPYFDHVAEVATLVEDVLDAPDQALIAAAYLHDVLEDTDATYESLAQDFGGDVAGLVVELSDPPGLDEAARRQAQIDHAPDLSARAQWIKIADKISNLEELHRDPPNDWSLAQKRAYLDWGVAVVDALGHVPEKLEQRFATIVQKLRQDLATEAPSPKM